MLKRLIFFVSLVGISLATYSGATINAVTLTTANTVYTIKAADTSRAFLRVNAVSGNIFLTAGEAGQFTSLNYGVYIPAGSAYEMNSSNLPVEKISAICTANVGKVLVFSGRKF